MAGGPSHYNDAAGGLQPVAQFFFQPHIIEGRCYIGQGAQGDLYAVCAEALFPGRVDPESLAPFAVDLLLIGKIQWSSGAHQGHRVIGRPEMRQHGLDFRDQQSAPGGQLLIAMQLNAHAQVGTDVDIRGPLHGGPDQEMVEGGQIAVESIGFGL